VLKRTPAITINFAGVDYRRLAVTRAALIGVMVLLVLCAGWLSLQLRSYRDQGAAMERQTAELAASQAKLRPEMQERQRLMKDLNAMSGLLEARRFSWTRLLTAIEEAFPSGIALTRVELNPREQIVVLEGAAQSPEALSTLMIGLQRSGSFRNPLLKHQSMDKGDLSFNVTVQYQTSLAAGPAPGPAQRSGD
jgi:Tfp pilus assembly protein PilN